MQDPRHIWDRRWAGADWGPGTDETGRWLACWQPILEGAAASGPVLDLGCGGGCASGYLLGKGLGAVAADFSWAALELAQAYVPRVPKVQMDLRDGLPFAAGAFGAVVADLSLHYFPCDQTRSVVNEIRERLRSGGYLLGRVNSTGDVNYGASGRQAVERSCYLVNGMLKRFFDRASLEELFDAGWRLHVLEEKVIHRYSRPKVVWEFVVQREKLRCRV